MLKRLFLLAWVASTIGTCCAETRWNPPLGPDPAPEYEVTVDGRKIELLAVQMIFEPGAQPVPDWGGVYWAAIFPYRAGAEIRVKSLTAPLKDAQFVPAGRVGQMARPGGQEISFATEKPSFRVVLEREGRIKPLLLFGDAPDTDLPDFSDPKVRRFGPGVHNVGNLCVRDNETLYLDYGAVLSGGITVTGTNVVVRGHGIVSGAAFPRFKGPNGHLLCGWNCRDLKVRDVTLTAPWSWTLVLRRCDGVEIDNIRILGSRMINDDAIDVVNSRNVVVRNSFLRAQDDLVAVKGCDPKDRTPAERILIENCDLWCDRANVFRIGYECEAVHMAKIAGRNLEVLHVSSEFEPWKGRWPHAVFWLQPSGGMPMRQLLFENVNVNLDGYDTYLTIANPRPVAYGKPRYTTGGSISNVVFRNVRVTGRQAACSSVVAGRSETEDVRRVRFENMRLFGRPLAADADVEIGPFTSDVKID